MWSPPWSRRPSPRKPVTSGTRQLARPHDLHGFHHDARPAHWRAGAAAAHGQGDLSHPAMDPCAACGGYRAGRLRPFSRSLALMCWPAPSPATRPSKSGDAIRCFRRTASIACGKASSPAGSSVSRLAMRHASTTLSHNGSLPNAGIEGDAAGLFGSQWHSCRSRRIAFAVRQWLHSFARRPPPRRAALP